MTEEKIEKYPKIVLGTDGSYQIFIGKDVEVRFESVESLNDFIKDKNFSIVGVKSDKFEKRVFKETNLIWETLAAMK